MRVDTIDLVDAQVRRAEVAGKRLAEEGVVPKEGPHPVITISRELGSGGRRVAEVLAEKLSFSIWNGELVEAMANDARVGEHLVRNFDERVISEIDVLLRHLVGQPRIGGFQYKRYLTRTLLQIARLGNAIILGRGGNFVLPHALNVRIIASRALRIHNMMEFEGMSRDVASRALDESDRERAEFTRRVWGRDWTDPLTYDLIIRMDEFTNQQAADIVAGALAIRLNTGAPLTTNG